MCGSSGSCTSCRHVKPLWLAENTTHPDPKLDYILFRGEAGTKRIFLPGEVKERRCGELPWLFEFWTWKGHRTDAEIKWKPCQGPCCESDEIKMAEYSVEFEVRLVYIFLTMTSLFVRIRTLNAVQRQIV